MPGRHFLRSDIFTIAIVGDSFFRLFPLNKGSKFFMLFKLINSVDMLWHSADVAGANTPATPNTIRLELIATIER